MFRKGRIQSDHNNMSDRHHYIDCTYIKTKLVRWLKWNQLLDIHLVLIL